MNNNYKIHMVSFENLDHPGSFNTLIVGRGQAPQGWQVELMRQYAKAHETLPVPPEDGSDLV
jgi:hypothetical protein